MSVVLPIEEDPRFRLYTASAGQTQFGIPFPFQQDRDISVLVRASAGSYTTISETAYTLTGAGEPEGILTFNSGRTAGDVILVLGLAALDRVSSITADGRFKSYLTDAEFDRTRIIQQEMQRDLKRAFKMDFGQSAPVPPPPEDARLLGWLNGSLHNFTAHEVVGLALSPEQIAHLFITLFAILPITLPSEPGIAWNNGGTISIS